MKITFTQYINNPLGEKNSVITNRGMYQKMYRDKLDKILLREGGKVKYNLYKSKDRYYIHFKIPSEVIDKFYYDTVIEFYTDDSLKERSPSLRDYNVKFYSNDPAFVYTFAHAFIKNNIFITDLESKMTKESVNTVAKEKNHKNLVGYVKSLFFAYLLIGDYGLFSKTVYDKTASKYSKTKLLKDVEHAKDKVKERQEAEEKKRKEEKRKKHNEERFISKEGITNPTKAIRNIVSTKKTASTSKIKNSKRVKKI